MTQGVEPLALGDFRTATSVDLIVYDFGAVSVIYSISLEGPFLRLLSLSQVLYENVLLLADSRQRVEDLQKAIEGMVERPKISDYVEDYLIFHVDGKEDAAVIDWNASLLFGDDMEDVQAVLEFANVDNVELLEMRYLDQQLDDALDQAYDALSKRMGSRFRRPGSFEADLRHVAQLQVDSALLFERVTSVSI